VSTGPHLVIDLRSFHNDVALAEPAADPNVPPAVWAAWRRAVTTWHDQHAHEVLLGAAAEHHAFKWLAQRYRDRAGDPIADRQLERVRRAVTAVLLATATHRPDQAKNPLASMVLAVAAMMALAIGGGVLMKAVHHRQGTTVTQLEPSGADPASAPSVPDPASAQVTDPLAAPVDVPPSM
jgi:hypothetical protein